MPPDIQGIEEHHPDPAPNPDPNPNPNPKPDPKLAMGDSAVHSVSAVLVVNERQGKNCFSLN